MSQEIVRFGELKIESFVQGLNNNWVMFSELPNLNSIPAD